MRGLDKPETTTIACFLRDESFKAWKIDDGAKEHWVPKSCCTLEKSADGKCYTLEIPVWLAKKKGMV